MENHHFNDPCYGCGADKYLPSCKCEHRPWNSFCPCTICLVKAMCREMCEEFSDFTDKCEDMHAKYVGRKPNYVNQ